MFCTDSKNKADEQTCLNWAGWCSPRAVTNSMQIVCVIWVLIFKRNRVEKVCAILMRVWLQKAWLELISLFTLPVFTHRQIGSLMHFPKQILEKADEENEIRFNFHFFTQPVVTKRDSASAGDLVISGKKGLILGQSLWHISSSWTYSLIFPARAEIFDQLVTVWKQFAFSFYFLLLLCKWLFFFFYCILSYLQF